MKRYVCIHGHFYQPPRENPWLEEIEVQDSARPFHDWNDRIAEECYGPNAQARILDEQGRIADIVNNYARISFNVGPTLLSWLERHRPAIHEAIIAADRTSRKRFDGHGSALAQVYNHMIMPLANRRDRTTQVIWGLEDFRRRFNREPEGIWLPETAVDLDTLEILADQGLRFTILAPGQAARVRPLVAAGEETPGWTEVAEGSIDPTRAYCCRLPSGRSIALFFYDGPISSDLAFGDLLHNGENLYRRLRGAFKESGRSWPQLVHIASDGETYGHHHRSGEMALAYALDLIEADPDLELTSYGLYLARHPPEWEVEIHPASSWSCAHGVERWRSDCGCHSGGHPDWHQGWRAPLRDAMNWLSDQAARIYLEQAGRWLPDPWQARDRYIEVLLHRTPAIVDRFLADQAGHLDSADQVTVLKLLELQRFAQLIFTSCGWFFDEISGLETVQVLNYAARCLQLAEELSGEPLEAGLLERLAEAPGNLGQNGREVYLQQAKPARIDLLRMGAHFAISSLFETYPDQIDLQTARVSSQVRNSWSAGRSMLVTGRAAIASLITREQQVFQYAVLHPGDHNLTCGLQHFTDIDSFHHMETDLKRAFQRGELTETIRLLDEHFGAGTYSIWHLFRDEQRKVVRELLTPAFARAHGAYRQIFETNHALLNFLSWLGIPLPELFLDAARHVFNSELKELLGREQLDLEQLDELLATAQKWSLRLDLQLLGYLAEQWLNRRLAEFEADPGDGEKLDLLVRTLDRLLKLEELPLQLWSAQNSYVRLRRKLPQDQTAGEPFRRLGKLLQVRVCD